MSSCAPTVTTMLRNRAKTNRQFWPAQRGPRVCCVGFMRGALVGAILALAGCASPHTRSPTAPPPAKSTANVTAAPVPGVVVLEQRSYEQDKDHIKLALAKNSRDSLASSDVGYYLDVLQGRLKQVADKSIGIDRQGDSIVIDFSFELGFESGSAQTNPGIREILTPLAKVLVEYRMTLVSVQARADESGQQAGNPRLAQQRALAVAHYLKTVGVAGKRIVIAGYGVDQAPATSLSPENRTHVKLQLEPIVRDTGSER